MLGVKSFSAYVWLFRWKMPLVKTTSAGKQQCCPSTCCPSPFPFVHFQYEGDSRERWVGFRYFRKYRSPPLGKVLSKFFPLKASEGYTVAVGVLRGSWVRGSRMAALASRLTLSCFPLPSCAAKVIFCQPLNFGWKCNFAKLYTVLKSGRNHTAVKALTQRVNTTLLVALGMSGPKLLP